MHVALLDSGYLLLKRIRHKCGVNSSGWIPKEEANATALGAQKNVTSVFLLFSNCISVKTGYQIQFWKDRWIGQSAGGFAQKFYLIKSEMVCKVQRQGGLGIRRFKDMNVALLDGDSLSVIDQEKRYISMHWIFQTRMAFLLGGRACL
ncbi:hypothetical protein AMTRI_Chr08g162310 [Amborella trichopoda]